MGPAWLKRHPFAVEATFDRSVVLTYAFPAEQLEGHLPECLEMDTFEERYAFVAAAAVQTRGLRPKGWPRWLGRDFLLIGYRIFARYETTSGRRLRGLYILRSETDRKSMELLGNLFTRYRYVKTDVDLRVEGDQTVVRCEPAGLTIAVDRGGDERVPLPPGSPFGNWTDARRFAGPLPFTFSIEPQSDEVVIIEGVRENWSPRPVQSSDPPTRVPVQTPPTSTVSWSLAGSSCPVAGRKMPSNFAVSAPGFRPKRTSPRVR